MMKTRFEPALPGVKYAGRVYGKNGEGCGALLFNTHPSSQSYDFFPDSGAAFCADTLRDIADALDKLNGVV